MNFTITCYEPWMYHGRIMDGMNFHGWQPREEKSINCLILSGCVRTTLNCERRYRDAKPDHFLFCQLVMQTLKQISVNLPWSFIQIWPQHVNSRQFIIAFLRLKNLKENYRGIQTNVKCLQNIHDFSQKQQLETFGIPTMLKKF